MCPELDDDEIDQLECLLETIGDNVTAWEMDYTEEQTTVEKCKERYVYSYNAFLEVAKQARFMPNTQ